MWNLELLERVKVFIWKCLRDILSVCSNLNTRMQNISPLCPLCGAEEETIGHLFCFCNITRAVWNNNTLPPPTLSFSSAIAFKDWLLDQIICYKDEKLFLPFISTLWSIWKNRNQLVFSNIQFDPNVVLAITRDTFSGSKRLPPGTSIIKLPHPRQSTNSPLLHLSKTPLQPSLIALASCMWMERGRKINLGVAWNLLLVFRMDV